MSRRPWKTTTREEQAIIREAKENPRLTVVDIHKGMLAHRVLNFCAETIKLRFVKNELFGRC